MKKNKEKKTEKLTKNTYTQELPAKKKRDFRFKEKSA